MHSYNQWEISSTGVCYQRYERRLEQQKGKKSRSGHTHTLKKKVSSRVALIKRLADVGWRASFKALRTSRLALAFAPAEYCAPVWCRSAHIKHIDVPLNESMYVVTGYLRSTPSFFPILYGITSSETRRNASCLKLYSVKAGLNAYPRDLLPTHGVLFFSTVVSHFTKS